jgi:ligand-binding sensor domain-containing protein
MFVLLSLFTAAQELPPIVNYEPSVYKADNQNWMLSQDDSGIIYAANNKGLLSFDGAHWDLYPSPNETILRSVSAIDTLVYTGAYMEFGQWTKVETGELIYTSLVEALGIEMLVDEQIWNIISYRDKVLFQSLNRIYIYQPSKKSIRFLEFDETVFKLFKVNDELFFQVYGKGMYTLKNGVQQLWSDSGIFKTETFINLFKIDGSFIGVTQTGNFYTFTRNEVGTWIYTDDTGLKDLNVYSAIQLQNESLAIGTISHGILLISKEGQIEHQINQQKGLENNTVLSLFEDKEANIWMGLDRGISCINNHLPFSRYIDREGRMGTTYAVVKHKGYTYLGTNQGLFYKSDGDENYQLIPGIDEQVWMLTVIDDTLFCGHNKGTFIIEQGRQKLVVPIQGTWSLKKVPGHPEWLMQGNFDGLYILEKKQGEWTLRNKIEGFDISSKFFEFAKPHRVLVSHEYKGVYEVEVDSAFAKAKSFKINASVDKGEHAGLVQFDSKIFYANKEGMFQYNTEAASFVRNDLLSDIYTNAFVSGKLVNDGYGKLWAFTKDHLIYITKDDLEVSYGVNKIQLSHALRATKKGYEHIARIDDDSYILGSSDGYLNINLSKKHTSEFQVSFKNITVEDRELNIRKLPLQTEANLRATQNSISFYYSVPEYDKYQITEYSYLLKNDQGAWSPWSVKAFYEFKNLPYGTYSFQVKARVGDQISSNIAHFDFVISRPWYVSNIAILVYVFLTFLLFAALNWFYKRYYRKQRERILEKTKRDMQLENLASEKEVVELRNQNLQKDIDARNRELATSTMTMVNKSKTLHKIKEALLPLNTNNTLDEILSLVDANINNKEDWNFFEEAFNHADKDFFKKVKEIHPSLTANDLKLCVYLRLNMSSKEIAPLLNISPRSVEIKRYRLRKKIHLDRSVNLNDYFINL